MKKWIALIAQIVVGSAFMGFGFWGAVTELRAKGELHITHLGAYMGVALFGALVLPTISGIVTSAATSGINLVRAGRRAYDPKIEEPTNG